MKKLLARAHAFAESAQGKKVEAWAIRVAVAYVCAKAGIGIAGAVPK